MDAAEYETNVLVLNNVCSIVYRTFEPPRDQSQNFGLKAVDVENEYREQGHIVYYDGSRRILWHFRAVVKDATDECNGNDTGLPDFKRHALIAGDEGTFEPATLQRTRLHQQAGQLPASTTASTSQPLDASQRHALASNPPTGPSITQEQDASSSNSTVVEVHKSGQGNALDSRIVYESFVFATLLSISTALSHRSGAVPLDYRTVLIPKNMARQRLLGDTSYGAPPVVGTLRAYVTSNGDFIVSMAVSVCQGLLSLNEALGQNVAGLGSRILAAPFGMIANGQLSASSESVAISTAQTPGTQALGLRGGPDAHDSTWKQTCLKFLQLRGVAQTRLTNCFWVSLLVARPKLLEARSDLKKSQVLGTMISIPWPSPLCFRRKPVLVPSTSRVGEHILRGHEESHDPLSNARAWFNSTNERDESIAKRKAERVAALQDALPSDSRSQRPNGQSPLNLRRPSAAAAGSMYPTPPDALQNVNGVTPSLDGTLSSPGNALSAVAGPDADQSGQQTTSTIGPFESGPDVTESKGRKSDGNLLGDAEHMFGDMGGDMFGDDDITEADFNFFDEEPGELDLDAALDGLGDSMEENSPLADAQGPEKAAMVSVPIEETELSKAAVVFTKPELRHAISAQNEGPVQRGRGAKAAFAKRESSPFDPHTVFKRVRTSLAAAERANIPTHNARMPRIFERMKFDPTLPMIDKKYEHGGQFDFRRDSSPEQTKSELGAMPDFEHLRRHGKQSRGSISSFSRPTFGFEPLNPASSPGKLETRLSDGYSSSIESDGDEVSGMSNDEAMSPLRSSVKQTIVDEDAASQVTSLKENDLAEEPDHQLAAELPRLTRPTTVETPLSVLFSDPEPLSIDLSLGDEDLIQVAQILTDQAATGTLQFHQSADRAHPSAIGEQTRSGHVVDAKASVRAFRDVASSFFQGIQPARLKRFLDVQDIPLQGQPSRLQPRPIPGRDGSLEQMRLNNLYLIPGPHLEVRRADVKLSVLPSAVTFWESLGLGPSSGGKDITAICVFPNWKGMFDNARTFLGRVKSVYEILRLGSVDSMELPPDEEEGILPFEVDRISTSPDVSLSGGGSSVADRMDILRSALSNLTASSTNVVVYFVYSPNNPGTIIEACAAFQRVFDSYQKELVARKEPAVNELVLQLVSAELLSSPTSVVVTPSPELFRLCIETYDRCTLFGGPMPAPAIRLEQPLPRIIDFKLVNTPSASLTREDSCIHVAYAQTVDERWISAAWTDDRGYQQATASYCLGRKNRSPSTSVNKVAHEIWESTLDLISSWKVHWKIIITKCGPIDQHEADCWANLARQERRASVTMVLMTADTDPFLQFMPPSVKLSPHVVSFYTTPVSTPQANIVSPEQSGTPATPANGTAAATPGGEAGAESEGDAVLTDVTDQTWGAILGHRLSSSLSLVDPQPVLASGYLVKRTGARIEDTPVAMEVNLVHADASPRAYEPLLREVLSYFRGLSTLSRARGMVPADVDVRPWHIAAAEKAARAMYLLM
ncbi:Mediator complex, subunit Med13 [Moelleriella libera RCEF 2490]|uniref:Mediator of RNA polymerase II transcription subunit 13 n=1 Tax=Moelleriella libera RCEF 2490 TaxID=1081109 RepID=A0A168CL24_9HYPO|nr:Mediator complex, subunit Med13 [Moelleriella libera RCEF 2490]